jgi:hypothetical protein
MSNELQIKLIQSRITSIDNVLSDSIETKVTELTQQINELTTKLNEVKQNSYYKYTITGELEGIFNTPGQLLNLSYGSGSPNENNFALYISHATRIHHMTFMSVFGPNEVSNPLVQLTINIMKYPENELVISYPFPNVAYGQPVVYHTGFTSQELFLDIPSGCMVYVYASSSNLIDNSARHRLSFEFKTNLF